MYGLKYALFSVVLFLSGCAEYIVATTISNLIAEQVRSSASIDKPEASEKTTE